MRGYVDSVTRSMICGWAADPAVPARSVALSIQVDGHEFGTLTANLQNDNLKRLFEGSTGAYAFRYEFAWPLSVFDPHRIEVRVVHTGELLPNGAQEIPAIGGDALRPPGTPPSMTPILVTSTGRAGSSLCMARLKAHPAIAVAGGHPYEILLLSYYALALRTLASQSDRGRSMHPDTMFGPQFRYQVGYNPFNAASAGQTESFRDYWNTRLPRELAATFSRLIEDYYAVVRESSGGGAVRYFAEKGQPNRMVRQAARMMFGEVREIVLIRDPRDLLCSYKSFWKAPVEDAVNSIRSQLQTLCEVRKGALADTHFVRYEDLVLDRDATMGRLWEFLGLPPSAPAGGDAELATFDGHGTSGSPERSIGRWRKDLSPAELALCAQKFPEVLTAFGYEPAV